MPTGASIKEHSNKANATDLPSRKTVKANASKGLILTINATENSWRKTETGKLSRPDTMKEDEGLTISALHNDEHVTLDVECENRIFSKYIYEN